MSRPQPTGFTRLIPRDRDPVSFVVDTQIRIARLMEARGMSNKELADALGVGKSRVSNMFGSQPNLTLETLAKVFLALGAELPRVTTDELDALLAADEAIMPPDMMDRQGHWQPVSEDTAHDVRPVVSTTTPAASTKPLTSRRSGAGASWLVAA
ncbi:helix-turn-helix domain-containing protein [Tistrella bauzanensis]|jgi:transcriptional regulator with XRE-family HTH domain|uniref:helix-turn-helix domain-containing protein n=1 Tax=Tistrella TaxID=171436 RepID=UPI0031F642EB